MVMRSSVMLPQFSHANAVVLSVLWRVCSSGRMWADLCAICATCAASSRLLMLGASHLVTVATAALVLLGSASCLLYALPRLLMNTPPRPLDEASVAPNHEGAWGNKFAQVRGVLLQCVEEVTPPR